MKKTVFILIAVLSTFFVSKAQNVSDTIFNDYYLPDFIDVEHCSSLLFYDETDSNTNNYMARNHYNFWMTGGSYETEHGGYGDSSGVLDRAQPCYTDTLLTIKGIAIGVDYRQLLREIVRDEYSKILLLYSQRYMPICQTNSDPISYYSSTPKGKLKLMNNTLNREITSVNIDTNFILYDTEQYSYIEYYFDSLVNVNGLFYIVEDVTETSTLISQMVFTECNFPYPSLVRTADDSSTTWVQWSEHFFNQTICYDNAVVKLPTYRYADVFNPAYYNNGAIPNTCQMYMFPIFAETDTTLGDGTYPDTNVCLYDVNVDRYSNVYPNPAKDIVTVQSSFKVREIEIHNALGQVVLRKQGSQNIETIDVSILESGVYVVRIKTQRGFANKKLIIK